MSKVVDDKFFTIKTNFITEKKEKPKKVTKRETKGDRIKEHLLDLVLSSTSHGLPSIFRTERPFFKIMWFLLFITSTGIGVWMLTKSVIDFFDYEVVSHINLNFEQPTQFPTVTLLMDYDDSLEKEFILEDYMIGCYFDGWKDCNLTEIEQKYNNRTDNFYYKFNSGKNSNEIPMDLKLQKIAGPDFGLWIDFFTGFPRDYNLNSSIHGISIYIHNSSLNPFSEWSLTISPGYSTSFIITRTYTSKQGKPYSDCVEGLIFPDSFDSIVYKHIVGTSKSTYRQKDCIDLCASQYLIHMCNSTSELCFISELWTKNTSTELSGCYDEYFSQLTSLDIFGYCSPYCPLECDSLKYDITVRTEPFSSGTINEFIKDGKVIARFPQGYNVTKEDIRNTVASFSVYYEDLVYTTIGQTPKTEIVDLISNMGGLLGLFIGVSFLSFGELFEIFFEIIFIILEKDAKKISLK